MPRLETLPQFANASRMQALLDMLRAEVDALALDIEAIAEQEQLAIAEGVHLDRWGAVLGWRRGTLTDATYRRVLQAILLARRSEGNTARIVAAAEALTLHAVEYRQLWHAAYRLTIDTSMGVAFDAELALVVGSILSSMAPAGVNSRAVESRGFRFDIPDAFDGLFMGRIL